LAGVMQLASLLPAERRGPPRKTRRVSNSQVVARTGPKRTKRS
jgi:hypothetical protein